MATPSSSSMSPLCRVLPSRSQKPGSLTRTEERLYVGERSALLSFSWRRCFQPLRETGLLAHDEGSRRPRKARANRLCSPVPQRKTFQREKLVLREER